MLWPAGATQLKTDIQLKIQEIYNPFLAEGVLMDKFINAAKANEYVEKMIQEYGEPNPFLVEITALLMDVLPKCDVVEVVRCGKCKHFDRLNKQCNHNSDIKLLLKRLETDFCSYGEE